MGVGGGQEVQPLIGDWIGGQECSRQTEGLEVGEAGHIVGPGEVQVDGAGRLGGLEEAWGPCTSGGPDETSGLSKDMSWGGTVGGAGVDPGEARSAQLLPAFPQADRHGAGGHLFKDQGHPHATHDPAGRASRVPPRAHLWQPPQRGRLTRPC